MRCLRTVRFPPGYIWSEQCCATGAVDPALLGVIATEIGLAEAIPAAADLLAGKVRGRIVVDVNR